MAIPWALGKGREYSSFVTFFFYTTKCGFLRIKTNLMGFPWQCCCVHAFIPKSGEY